MTTFDGIVTVDDKDVDVVIGLDADKVTLQAGNIEVGNWESTDCVITDRGDGTWMIEAEEEKLVFLPEDPGGFAAELTPDDQPSRSPEPDPDSVLTIVDAPPPSLPTLLGFYALVALTVGLGAWAVISLFG